MAEDWSDAELEASVDAYLEMARLEEQQMPYSKREVYRELAARFDRTEKAFEYRMQNISSVLNELGRPWIPGLKPAGNVGANVKSRIEALLDRPNRDGFELMVPSVALAALVGSGPMSRQQMTKKIWQYIKTNGLQDKQRKTRINPDAKLAAVVGTFQLSMFDMERLVNKQLGPLTGAEAGMPSTNSGSFQDTALSETAGPATLIGIQPPRRASKSERLPADALRKATPEQIYAAVQRLLTEDVEHAFGESTDYDLIADDGSRLPPKAVFGLALAVSLGEPIEPKHFTAGETSPCFKLLRAAGYQVVPKGEAAQIETGDLDADEDAEWSEGKKKLVQHIVGERQPGLAKAKKAQYRRQHGKLSCERCGLDPVAEYGTPHGEACIEVHHATTQVSEMQEGHKTTLADLQCMCANCHRFVHRAMRHGISI